MRPAAELDSGRAPGKHSARLAAPRTTTDTIADQARRLRRRAARRLALMVLGCVAAAAIAAHRRPGEPSGAHAFFIDERQSPHTTDWSYQDQLAWQRAHRDCSGRAQSPIDIQHKNVIISQQLRLHFYNYNKPLRFKLSNAHHTIKMNPTGLAAYDGYEHAGGGGGGGGPLMFNHSAGAGHDIITAADNEYVELAGPGAAVAGPRDQQGGNGRTTDDNDPLSKLIAAGPAPPPPPPPGGGHPARPPPGAFPGGRERPKSARAHEREREHEAAGAARNSLDEFEAHKSGHADANREAEPYEGAPTIKLDWLDDGNNEYKLRDIHFHWGERRDNGSEHAIDGRRAAMEMHLVHIKHGLDKSKIGFTSDSVTVIAILIESHRKSNADFNPIVNELARVNTTDLAQEIDYKSIYDLLPSNLRAFYTYSGSLTTPPCYQVVNWIVMAERLNMNAKQIEMFRNLYAPPKQQGQHQPPRPLQQDENGGEHEEDHRNHLGGNTLANRDDGDDGDHEHHRSSEPRRGDHQGAHHVEMIMPNVRTIQPLNNRTILASFTKYGSRLEVAQTSANLFAPISLASPSGPAPSRACLFGTLVVQLLSIASFLITVGDPNQNQRHRRNFD